MTIIGDVTESSRRKLLRYGKDEERSGMQHIYIIYIYIYTVLIFGRIMYRLCLYVQKTTYINAIYPLYIPVSMHKCEKG